MGPPDQCGFVPLQPLNLGDAVACRQNNEEGETKNLAVRSVSMKDSYKNTE